MVTMKGTEFRGLVNEFLKLSMVIVAQLCICDKNIKLICMVNVFSFQASTAENKQNYPVQSVGFHYI